MEPPAGPEGRRKRRLVRRADPDAEKKVTDVKVLILAGGLGTRLGEETSIRPKPMVEIGSQPILWHIMKYYAAFGHTEFGVLMGYKHEVIVDYFMQYHVRHAHLRIDLCNNDVQILKPDCEPWIVNLLNTGRDAMTGARIRKARELVGNSTFMLTYGDGLSDVDLNALLSCHRKSGKLATLTAVQPAGRFGALELAEDGTVNSFQEKPQGDGAWINGGFFVLEPDIFDLIPEGDAAVWEGEPLKALARSGQLNAYKHRGFWHPMDMLKDKLALCALWEQGRAPWKIWP